jgi:hypothetical protein
MQKQTEDMDKDMETWTRTWKHGRGHGNMDEDMEAWTRTWKHGRGHGNMDEDMEAWTNTWKHGRGHESMDEDMEIFFSLLVFFMEQLSLLFIFSSAAPHSLQ